MAEVFVVSHHEGLVAVAATAELADRILAGFVAKYGHMYGKPWVERVQVQDDSCESIGVAALLCQGTTGE